MKKACCIFLIILACFACQRDSDDDSSPTEPKSGNFIIHDPLLGSTVGQLFGGTLTADGYLPGKGKNHILYRLPSTVREGYIEVEVKGMNRGKIPANEDHGFLAMYDGRGVGEPIIYSDDFKQNYFRWNIHWRQNTGTMKCVITCADPKRQNDSRAVFPPVSGSHDHHRDWSKEPNGSGFSWNQDVWHTLRVEWQQKTFRVFVDGVKVWQVSGPYHYAPVDHRIWLGSGPGKYSSELSQIMYRNFRVQGF